MRIGIITFHFPDTRTAMTRRSWLLFTIDTGRTSRSPQGSPVQPGNIFPAPFRISFIERTLFPMMIL